MGTTYFVPDTSHLQSRVEDIAAREAEREAARRSDGLYPYSYVWRDSEKLPSGLWKPETVNKIRILPPWSEEVARSGRIGLEVFTHFAVPPEWKPHLCMGKTYPELGIECPICALLERIEKEFGDTFDLWQQRAALRYYFNALDVNAVPPANWGSDARANKRKKNTPSWSNTLVVVVDFPAALGDWIMQKTMDPEITASGFIFDPDSGFTLNVYRTVSGTGNEKQVRYEKELSVAGRTPIHVEPEVRAKILSELIPLNRMALHAPKNSAEMEKMTDLAEAAYRYYVQKGGEVKPKQSPPKGPGVGGKKPEAATSSSEPPPPTQGGAGASVADKKTQERSAAAHGAPSDRPACFAGAAPRPDGGTGPEFTSENCQKCPHESECNLAWIDRQA